MLSIPLETLAFIITKAREYDAEVPPAGDEEDGSNAADDGEREILEDGPDNPTGQELEGAIRSLNEPQRIELLALMWLGRGDYDAKQWREALHEAAQDDDAKKTRHLLETPLLGDFLEEGLSQLGYSIEDYEIGRL